MMLYVVMFLFRMTDLNDVKTIFGCYVINGSLSVIQRRVLIHYDNQNCVYE